MHVIGACSPKAWISAPLADRPAVAIGPDADSSHLRGFGVTGGNAGVAVDGAADVQLVGLEIFDVSGPGISFEDSQGSTGGHGTGVVEESTFATRISAAGRAA